jgi:WD40 repeat protein
MSRSLKVRYDCLKQAKLALKYQGFANQKSLAKDLGMALSTVSNFLTGKPVDAQNFMDICAKLALDWESIADLEGKRGREGAGERGSKGDYTSQNHLDWGEAIDVSHFYGRTAELNKLEEWIRLDRCRLVALLGMGGIGKTALSVKLAETVVDDFEYLIWRSLRNAIPVENLLAELIQFFSNQQETELDLAKDLESRISRLIYYLRQHRCLLVLDNVETILEKERAGNYREGYRGYGELLQRIGEIRHQSCLLLTSREKPKEISWLEGDALPVRSISLSGLNVVEARAIFQDKGDFAGAGEDWQALIQHYAGNPLALKMVAPAIRDKFNSDLANFLHFLAVNPLVFDDIRDLLDQQFDRLSQEEKEVMYWLAIDREWVSISELREDLLSLAAKSNLLETLKRLGWRSLIEVAGSTQTETKTAKFTQQPVVMEYMSERLIDKITSEINSETLELFLSHALIKATAKDYLRESQIRLILQPIADRLLDIFKSKEAIAERSKRLILKLRDICAVGYGAGNQINLLRQLKIDLTGFDFSDLPIRQAYLCELELHQVNFAGADLTDSVFLQTFSSAISVAYSPDGNLLATGDIDGTIRLWQVETGQQLSVLKGHKLWVRSIAFSSDCQTLVSASYDLTVKLWKVKTGDCQTTFLGHRGVLWSVAFSSNDRFIASAGFDNTVRVWDVETGETHHIFEGCSLAFSADDRTLFTGSYQGFIKVWDLQSGTCLQTLTGHRGFVSALTCSRDGQILASCSHDRTIVLWNLQIGQPWQILQGHKSEILAIDFSRDSQILASGSDDGILKLWDVKTGKCLRSWQGHKNPIFSVAFSPDDRALASGGEDCAIALWNVPAGYCIKTLQGYTNQIRSVAFSRDGSTVASGSEDLTVRIWNVETGACLHTLAGHNHHVTSVTYSPDGQTLATGSYDYSIRFWDIIAGKCLKILSIQGYISRIQSIAYSLDGQILASGSVGKGQTMLRLWDGITGELIDKLPDYLYMILAVAFAPGERQILATAGEEGLVRFWDLAGGECVKVLSGHQSVIQALDFSSNGRLLVSGGGDGIIKLWDVATGECLQTLSEHRGLVYSVKFSPDGGIFASASGDGTIKLWDVATSQCYKTLQQEIGWVYTLAFAPDSTLASGGQDGTIKLWNIETGEILKTFMAKRPYEGLDITGVKGLTNATIAALKTLGAIVSEN